MGADTYIALGIILIFASVLLGIIGELLLYLFEKKERHFQ